jgi:homoserine kinase
LEKPIFSIGVKVPATSANLGPGFDVLGVALDLFNEVELIGWPESHGVSLQVEIQGEGALQLPDDDRNLLVRMARKILDRRMKKVKVLEVRLLNRIPLARGLGSSSAAIVGGLVAANAACPKPLALDNEDLLRIAVEEEGHPDNVTPALVGGLCVATPDDADMQYVSWKDKKLFEGLRAVVCIPDFELSTAKARALLPKQVSRQDAVFNASHTALFLSALQNRRHDLLGAAMQDKLHQPYRKKLIPGWDDVLAAAKKAGAFGVCLSGAGPTILALSPSGKADSIGRAMSAAFAKHRITANSLNLGFNLTGAQITLKHKQR